MAATELLSGFMLKGFAELCSNLIESYVKTKLDKSPERVRRLKSDITPHIEATFKKCSVIKTLLNPHTPIELLSIYATQRFSISGKAVDQYSMVDHIKRNNKGTVITGTGGSGKSMFTKYLWLSLFVDSRGRIPLFFELRNINTISVEDLLVNIKSAITQAEASLSDEDFRDHLKSGDFIIILDGFDELLQQKKDSVQKQIVSISENYPDVKIVVTSRPDDRFAAWPAFDVSLILPMEKKDVIELISKAEFPDESKGQFLKRLKETTLFQKQRSFLSNPLLASMMLLTFSHNFDISNRMHVFYQQAFEALYQRHDRHKPGGFKREFETDLPEDVFKRILSYFCLITYYEEKFSFSKDEAVQALKSAITVAGAKAEPSRFLNDLNACVCILILDGGEYVFSHRSFQEYFTACCMTFVDAPKFELLAARFSSRLDDQVMPLLADINPEILRRYYILPIADRYKDQIEASNDESRSADFYKALGVTYTLEVLSSTSPQRADGPGFSFYIHLPNYTEFFRFASLLQRLNKSSTQTPAQDKNVNKNVLTFARALNVTKGGRVVVRAEGNEFSFAVNRRKVSNPDQVSPERILNLRSDMRKKVLELFKLTPMYDHLSRLRLSTSQYVKEQRLLETQVAHAMSDIFKSQLSEIRP